MSAERISEYGLILKRILGSARDFAGSEVGWKAKILFVSLLFLMLAINGLNVLNSYVGRDFMTAIENRYMGGFVWYTVLYLGVFAATTVAAVIYRYCEERLGLLWREWLTRRLVNAYLDGRVYYCLDESQEVANPDQRIAEDVKAFTVTTLSFTLMLLNSSFTVLAFSGVMWSISPLLFGVAVAYAVAGSYFTVRLGRPSSNSIMISLTAKRIFARVSSMFARMPNPSPCCIGNDGFSPPCCGSSKHSPPISAD